MPWSRAMDLVRTGAIQDGKTLVSLLFLQCFSQRTSAGEKPS